ncbi:hypothetical protein L4X42_17580 [Phocaeicola vulgatus]|uniref:hypothetical protein n=1 Tax=Phocaeicola vulgatus TaxID=821 RepID=UPI001F332066|nr:hypothetical protein [Phocaeicola vulgatus]MCG0196075.1 hypothetical protein [Phocaeicola vulgatus]
MFKEAAYWMYYFWSKNKRARKDKAVISNATWTMAILWFLNLTALHLLFEAWGWDMLTGWFSSLTDKVEWSRFNPVAYLFAAAMLAPFIWIARKLYYRPAKLKAMQAKYETMGEYRKLLGQCLFWLYITGSFASFFIIAEQKNHSKEQPLIERLQEIRDGKYPVEKTHSPTDKTYSPTGE